jgi:hypothetical protein
VASHNETWHRGERPDFGKSLVTRRRSQPQRRFPRRARRGAPTRRLNAA